MAKFAKIIELENEQLVVTKGWGEELPAISISTNITGIGEYVQITEFDTEKERDHYFDSITKEVACSILKQFTDIKLTKTNKGK